MRMEAARSLVQGMTEGERFPLEERRGHNKNFECARGFGGGGSCGGEGGYSGGGVQVNGRRKKLDLHAGGGGSFVPNNDRTVLSGEWETALFV